MLLSIRVKPKAKQPFVSETADGGFVVAVREAPADGRANAAVLKAVAEYFHVAPSRIRLIRGFASRHKILEISQ